MTLAAPSAADPARPSVRRGQTVLGLFLATHPGPTVAVVGYATATAAASGLGARSALLAVAVLLGQASVGWSNDWIDAGRDIARARRDKPIPRGLVSRDVVRRGALIALTLCVPASFALGWRAGIAHLVAVLAAWSYNLGVKRTLASPLPYFVAFAMVPVVVAWALPAHPSAPWRLVLASGLLGVSAHLPNAVEDLADDTATGVRGLPQRLGVVWSMVASTIVLVTALGLFLSLPGRATPAAIVLACIAATLSGASVVRALSRRTNGLFALSVLAVLPLVVAVAATGGVRG
ncbi:MAG: UbiA family prenyltransferase [Actinomycetes bacterium]